MNCFDTHQAPLDQQKNRNAALVKIISDSGIKYKAELNELESELALLQAEREQLINTQRELIKGQNQARKLASDINDELSRTKGALRTLAIELSRVVHDTEDAETVTMWINHALERP